MIQYKISIHTIWQYIMYALLRETTQTMGH